MLLDDGLNTIHTPLCPVVLASLASGPAPQPLLFPFASWVLCRASRPLKSKALPPMSRREIWSSVSFHARIFISRPTGLSAKGCPQDRGRRKF